MATLAALTLRNKWNIKSANVLKGVVGEYGSLNKKI